MAATQAENQQNDVNSDKSQQEQHLNARNSLLQNGTDKTCVIGDGNVVITKGKATGSMSQYRQDSGGEQGLSEPEMGPAGNDSSLYSPTSGVPSEGPPVGDGHAYGFPFGGRDMHNSGDGSLHGFNPRQSFGNPKHSPTGFPQQRFLSGQTISQPTGPTPTLNQLLQSSNPMHRYQNSYGHPDQPYGQGWPVQKPLSYSASSSPGPTQSGPVYRNNQTLSTTYTTASPSSPGYGESRTGWPGQAVPGQHGPGSPGPPSTTTPSQQSPQPQSLSPGPVLPPSPNSQHQTLQTHQNYPTRPPSSTTPNTHAPDPADLSGGNSNDSSGGPAPGTPNSQTMRPTPSPTGSTGSRSMSPAVVQQNIPMPPRPSSSQSDGGGPSRLSHSPMNTQSSFPPTHMHAYKGHPSMAPSGQQQMPLYQPNQQYTQGGYPPRPQSNVQYPNQSYSLQVSQSPNNAMPAQQYPNRSTSNHMANSQFPPYTQSWSGPTATPGNHLPGGKGNNHQQAPNSPSSSSQRPPHYLKQHLQHKMGFGNAPSSIPPSPSPPQNYHMGPPTAAHHSGMGPPSSMGPPNMSAATSPLLPNSHMHDGPMPPPSSTPNSHHPLGSEMMDNGITTTAGTLSTHVIAASSGSVTSVITTGPDGAPIDEGSQQSTLSNASAASGEDPQCTTPKSRKNDISHYSHPTTPQSTVPSPGAASMNSMHEEYGDLSSPSWPRTPASPKTDSLSKLYEMDDSPDRRSWLDKLLGFMEERRSPITTCPTISKNPLDLFRLYVFVKERGGFMEVTKNKTWKDIAGMLGIGASSSAAYTLRKHYTKNLLAYECQFDRGGIDPQPIINQVEASSKKKGSKSASVPSPGSSNSQDSFPTPGSGGASLDGYSGYGYPSGSNPDYNSPQRPSSQANAPSPHGGSTSVNHLGNPSGGPSPAGGVADNVNVSNPFDDISPSPPPRGAGVPFTGHPPFPTSNPPRPQNQNYTNQPGYNQYPGPGPGAPPDQYSTYPAGSNYPPASRSTYPSYAGDAAQSPSSPNSSQTPCATGQDPYNRYNMNSAPGAAYPVRPAYGNTPGTTTTSTTPQPAAAYNSQQEFYRNEQNFPNQQNLPTTAAYPGAPPNKNMPPPAPQPRRHPDFANKDQQQNYSQYGQPRPQVYSGGGWPNNNQYRGQFVGSTNNTSTPPTPTTQQQWNQGSRPSGQWDRFPSGTQAFQPSQQGQQQWTPMPTPGVGQSSPLRPLGPRSGKPFGILQQQTCKTPGQQQTAGGSLIPNQLPKREITFPPDSVEATLPVLYRRKRLCRSDIGPIDPWRIIMSLKSGLLSESCYALDVLTVLLFDDSSVAYFGLNQWPGLLEILLEYICKSLADMFDEPCINSQKDEITETDLGVITSPVDPDAKVVLFKNTPNYSRVTRKGWPVKVMEQSDDVFVQDNQKCWDVRGDRNKLNLLMAGVVTNPWQHSGDHILTTFQAEFGQIPFYRTLNDVKTESSNLCIEPEPHRTTPPLDMPVDELRPTTPPIDMPVDEQHRTTPTLDVPVDDVPHLTTPPIDVPVDEPHQTTPPIDVPVEVPPDVLPSKPSDKKRRTKTLSDVISRIKKDTADENDVLALEIKEKIKTEVVSETINCVEQPSVDLNVAVKKEECKNGLVRDSSSVLKRRHTNDYEDEAYTRDEASLFLLPEAQDNIGKRCVCISNVLRSLTFIPGNEIEFARNHTFLSITGKLLLLHHDHPLRTQKTRNYDREEDADFADSCSSLQGESEWWWDFLIQLRENMLVSISNIAGHIDLSEYGEDIARPLLDGLLHWAICPSAQGQDPFASAGLSSLLSPQRLALEALCKLCVTNSNVDLVIATPPFSRLIRLCSVLTKHLCRSEDQVLREFSINLLHYLAAADSSMSRVIALQLPCISLLVAFIEQAEQSALGVANQHGIGALRDNPDSMGTSLDMLRRAAATLVFLARHPDNKPLLIQQEPRLLALVMSQILDQQVALLLSKVLFQISRS